MITKPIPMHYCNKCGYYGLDAAHEGCNYLACPSLDHQYAVQLEEQLAESKENNRLLQLSIETLGRSCKRWEQKCEDLETERQSYLDMITTHEHLHDELKKELDHLRFQADEAGMMRVHYGKQIEELKQENKELRKDARQY